MKVRFIGVRYAPEVEVLVGVVPNNIFEAFVLFLPQVLSALSLCVGIEIFDTTLPFSRDLVFIRELVGVRVKVFFIYVHGPT